MDLTTRSQQAVSAAVRTAAERGNPATEPAHLAVALLDDTEGLTRPLLATLGVDPLQRPSRRIAAGRPVAVRLRCVGRCAAAVTRLPRRAQRRRARGS